MKRRKVERCVLWPLCSCSYLWNEFGRIFAENEDRQWSRLAVVHAEEDIFNMLNCVGRSCPDARYRRHAIVELMHPVWAHRRPEHERMEAVNLKGRKA